MKKALFFLTLIFTFTACSLSEDNPKYTIETLPVDSYTLPSSFTLGQTYAIKLKYRRPSNCHYFDGIYYDKNLNVRTIAIQTKVLITNDCKPVIDDVPIETSFNFIVTSNGSYIFKFYKGVDAAGKDIFESKEVQVIPTPAP